MEVASALMGMASDGAQAADDSLELSKSIIGIVQSWVAANQAIPAEIAQLRLLATTINSTCAHLATATDAHREILESIASHLRSAKALLEEYAAKKQSKWHFNPKKILRKIKAVSGPLESHFKLLVNALKVAGPVQANVSTIISRDEPDALLFWSSSFGEGTVTVDYRRLFVEAFKAKGIDARHLLEGRFPAKISAFRFQQALERFGGWNMLLGMVAFQNPFSEESLDGCVGAGDGATAAAACGTPQQQQQQQHPQAQQARQQRGVAGKRASSKKYFYVVSETGLVLGLYNDMSQPGVAVVAGPPRLSPFQQWKIDGLGCLRNRATGLAVDISQTAEPGRPLVQWPPHGGASQRWNICADGVIHAWETPQLCVDVDMAGQGPVKPVILWTFRDITPRKPNQVWRICNYIPMAPPPSH